MELKKIINIINNYNGIFAREYDLSESDFNNYKDSFDFPVEEVRRIYYKDYEGGTGLMVYRIKCSEIIIK